MLFPLPQPVFQDRFRFTYPYQPAAPGSGALRLHPDQAAQAGPHLGVRHLFAEAGAAQDRAGAPLAATAVALDGLAAVLHFGCEGTPVGIVEGRLDLPVEGALVALEGQDVVGAVGPQGLHNGRLAAGGVDRDHGPLQVDAVEQTGEGRNLVALAVARFLGHGQPLPHQEGAHQVQGTEARGPVARAARHLAVQGQDQLLQAGQAGAVEQPQGRLHGRLRVQPPDQAQVGVAGGRGVAQGQPQPEPGLVVVREGGHGRHAVGAAGQRHQQCGQEHRQGVAHAARVARIGQGGQVVGEGAQGGQEFRVGACDNVWHEGCSVSFEVLRHPIRRMAALFVALAATGNRSLNRIVCAGLFSINVGFVSGSSLTAHTLDQPFTDPFHPRPATLRLPWEGSEGCRDYPVVS